MVILKKYAEIYDKKLLNKRCNPKLKTKKIEYKVEIENETQLKERIAKLEKKLTIKDDVKNNLFYFDATFKGERLHAIARYNNNTKDSALDQIKQKKEDKIKELTVYFD